jgi:hypothetical protein
MRTLVAVVAIAASAEGMRSAAFRQSAGVSSVQMSTVASTMPTTVKPGVVTGKALMDLLEHAKANKYAIPAVNVVSSSAISACLEAAKKYKSPMIIQFSRGGGQFIAGKAADNKKDAACIAGCVAAALHVRQVAHLYGIPVILHTDHCMKSWLPWFDGLLDANEKYFAQNGEPLFSSHMLDLSEVRRWADCALAAAECLRAGARAAARRGRVRERGDCVRLDRAAPAAVAVRQAHLARGRLCAPAEAHELRLPSARPRIRLRPPVPPRLRPLRSRSRRTSRSATSTSRAWPSPTSSSRWSWA